MGWDLLLVVSIGLKMSVHFLVHEALFPPKTGIVVSEQTHSVYSSAFQSSLGILNSQFRWLTQICCTCSWTHSVSCFSKELISHNYHTSESDYAWLEQKKGGVFYISIISYTEEIENRTWEGKKLKLKKKNCLSSKKIFPFLICVQVKTVNKALCPKNYPGIQLWIRISSGRWATFQKPRVWSSQ